MSNHKSGIPIPATGHSRKSPRPHAEHAAGEDPQHLNFHDRPDSKPSPPVAPPKSPFDDSGANWPHVPPGPPPKIPTPRNALPPPPIPAIPPPPPANVPSQNGVIPHHPTINIAITSPTNGSQHSRAHPPKHGTARPPKHDKEPTSATVAGAQPGGRNSDSISMGPTRPRSTSRARKLPAGYATMRAKGDGGAQIGSIFPLNAAGLPKSLSTNHLKSGTEISPTELKGGATPRHMHMLTPRSQGGALVSPRKAVPPPAAFRWPPAYPEPPNDHTNSIRDGSRARIRLFDEASRLLDEKGQSIPFLHEKDSEGYYKPVDHKEPHPDFLEAYWHPDQPSEDNYSESRLIGLRRQTLTVLVPCYNEERTEIMETLESLHGCARKLVSHGVKLHIVVMQDGWYIAPSSTKRYLRDLYGPDSPFYLPYKEEAEDEPVMPIDSDDEDVKTMVLPQELTEEQQFWMQFTTLEPPLEDDLNDAPGDLKRNPKKWVPPTGTYIFQRIGRNGIEPVALRRARKGEDQPPKIRLSFLVKMDNRKKHNTHSWFLNSFVHAYNRPFTINKFCFLTDCGTKYDRDCLRRLLDAMWDHPFASGATGRQRVMTAEMQGAKSESIFSTDHLLRASQGCDYEMSLAIFMGAFGLLGLLPVIPGPCGMYRCSTILETWTYGFVPFAPVDKFTGEIGECARMTVEHPDHHNKRKKWQADRATRQCTHILRGDQGKRPSDHRDPRYGTPCGVRVQERKADGERFVVGEDCSLDTSMLWCFGVRPGCCAAIKRACCRESRVLRKMREYPAGLPGTENGETNNGESTYLFSAPALLAFIETKKRDYLIPGVGVYQSEAGKAWLSWLEHVVLPYLVDNQRLYRRLYRTPRSSLIPLGMRDPRIKRLDVATSPTKPSEKEAITRAKAKNALLLDNDDPDEEVVDSRDAVTFYTETLRQDAETSGLLVATYMLAEDRILSAAAVLKAKTVRAYTMYVPRAKFFFEAETRPELLLQQRRRWINGTVAGYVWFMTQLGTLYRSKMNGIAKIVTAALVLLQILMYAVVSIGPSIFALSFYRLMRSTAGGVNWWFILYSALYLVFVYCHCRRPPAPRYNAPIFWVIALMNGAMTVWLIITFCLDAKKKWDEPYDFSTSSQDEDFSRLTSAVVILSAGLPFGLALMHDLESFVLMIKQVPFFLLFQATMVAYLGSYAFSRTWELTWGNRPEQLKASRLNIEDKARTESKKKEIAAVGDTITAIVVALNALTVMITIVYVEDSRFLVLLAALLFFSAFMHASLSLLFYMYYGVVAIFLLKTINCCKRFRCGLCCEDKDRKIRCCCYMRSFRSVLRAHRNVPTELADELSQDLGGKDTFREERCCCGEWANCCIPHVCKCCVGYAEDYVYDHHKKRGTDMQALNPAERDALAQV